MQEKDEMCVMKHFQSLERQFSVSTFRIMRYILPKSSQKKKGKYYQAVLKVQCNITILIVS